MHELYIIMIDNNCTHQLFCEQNWLWTSSQDVLPMKAFNFPHNTHAPPPPLFPPPPYYHRQMYVILRPMK